MQSWPPSIRVQSRPPALRINLQHINLQHVMDFMCCKICWWILLSIFGNQPEFTDSFNHAATLFLAWINDSCAVRPTLLGTAYAPRDGTRSLVNLCHGTGSVAFHGVSLPRPVDYLGYRYIHA